MWSTCWRRATASRLCGARSCGDEELVTPLEALPRGAVSVVSWKAFGLPIAEALSLVVPVIASDLSVFQNCWRFCPSTPTPSTERAGSR